MPLQFILTIEKATESNTIIGRIVEIPGSRYETDHFPDLIDWANKEIVSYLSSEERQNEPYQLRWFYDHGFITNIRKDDPEPIFVKNYMDMLVGQANICFDSASQFAKIALNSLILLNGGATIAVLTFYGNLIEKALIIDNLARGIAGFALGLFLAMLSCGIGFLCQNSQTREIGCNFHQNLLEYCTLFRFEKLPIVIKEALDKNRPSRILLSLWLRTLAVVIAFLSLFCFIYGSLYSLVSFYENISNANSDPPWIISIFL